MAVPLLLEIKAGEKLIINGVVLECVGANTRLLVHNQAAILRQKEVLTKEQAATPAARVYFALQCAYVFPRKYDTYMVLFEHFLHAYLAAAPGAAAIAADIRAAIAQGNLYQAMKRTQRLLAYEGEAVDHLQTTLKEELARRDHGDHAPSSSS